MAIFRIHDQSAAGILGQRRAAVRCRERFPDFLLIMLSRVASASVDRRRNANVEAA